MNKIQIAFLLLGLLVFSNKITAQLTGGGNLNPDLYTHQASLQQFRDIKFGLFVHWGPVSLRGTEIGWSRGKQVSIEEYDELYKEFNPVLFDADAWVRIAKNAGMKYLVFTAKHHDGFCNWDSEFTDYDIAATPYKKDILQQLSTACKKEGILFGIYYSVLDWKHPHYTTRYGGDDRPVEESNMPTYVQYLRNQVKELIERYDPDILWFDGEWEKSWTHEYGTELYKFIREIKDDILVNSRVDKGKVGFGVLSGSHTSAGDYNTPEQRVGTFDNQIAWESCITICNQWAWKPNDKMKSLEESLHTLIKTIGGDGNLLYNVGPMPDGRIEARQIKRLEEMGKWISQNSESIYNTRGGPYLPTDNMISTHSGNYIFLHLMNSPHKSLKLPLDKSYKIEKITYLYNSEEMPFERNKTHFILNLPEELPDSINTVIKIQLNKPASGLGVIERFRY